MGEEINKQEELELLKATFKMNAKVLGIALGLLFGIVIFVATNWLIFKGGSPNESGQVLIGPHLALLGQYFIGYRVSFFGSLVGFAYAFVVGSLPGWLLAVFYTGFAGFRRDCAVSH